jgi:hypothetical protein
VAENSQIAQGIIVDLILHLVSASSPKPNDRRFPRRDSIGQHGPDGFLDTDRGYPPFVPVGKSYWEIGTGNDANVKATKDYKSLSKSIPQTERLESTFVFVTPLSGRTTWAYTWKKDSQKRWLNARRKQKKWHNVEIIDGTKLIDWMQHFPSVELWLAQEMGIKTDQIETLEQRWSTLKKIGYPPELIPDLFLKNRDDACKKLNEIYLKNIRQLKIETYHPDQVPNFIAAYLASVDEDFRLDTSGLSIIVKKPEVWNAMTELDAPHFLIADFDLDGEDSESTLLVERAKQANHAVVYSGLPGGLPIPRWNLTSISDPRNYQIQDALEKAGYNQGRAIRLAQKSDGRLNILLRLISNLSETPGWAQGTAAEELAIAELIGSWDENSKKDCEIIENISGNSYGEWIGKIRDIAFQPGTPLIVKENAWKFVNRYEGWYSLGSRLFDEHLNKFTSAAIQVLSEKDPKFQLPPEQRFTANIQGKVFSFSNRLRKGLAESLALLGSHPDALTNYTKIRAEAMARKAVHEILFGSDWILWASLNDLLPLLAEAAPKEFLKCVDDALNRDPCPFDILFAEENREEVHGLGGANYMTGLLWSLELLAWDPEYFTHVVVALGELSRRDPGGKWGNRPSNSLVTIFLPWLPQTCATIQHRKSALETLGLENSLVAWKLLVSLLPTAVSTTLGSYRPRWRECIPDNYTKKIQPKQYWEQVSNYAELLLRMASEDIPKLSELLEHFSNLPVKTQDQFLELLMSEKIQNLPESDKLLLWTKLVNIVNRNRKYKAAELAMEKEKIDRISAIADSLAPQQPFYRHQRLFSEDPFNLFDDDEDFSVRSEKLEKARNDAVKEILDSGGISAILQFAQQVISPWNVGISCGLVSTNEIDSNILPNLIDIKDKSLVQFSSGFIAGKFRIQGWQWVDKIGAETWRPTDIGLFLAYLPFTSETWDRVSKFMKDHESLYWNNTNANPFEAKSNLDFAIKQLIKHNRPITAIRCLDGMMNQKQTLDLNLIVNALEANIDSKELLTSMDQHAIIEVIKILQDSPNTNPDDLFKIEWMYLPLLDYPYNAAPKYLEQKLANEPGFFCEIIRSIFRSKKDKPGEKIIDEKKRNVAMNAYRLLEKWKTPPGLKKDGTFNGDSLVTWLNVVKEECAETGHLDVAMIHVGQVLIHTPPEDGLWIHRSAAEILNERSADKMREGFRVAFFNSRGAHMFTSGEEEEKLEKEYRKKAEAVESQGFYLLAETLKDLADSYRREAEEARKNNPIDELDD